MKINFNNYEIVRADFMSLLPMMDMEKTEHEQRLMNQLQWNFDATVGSFTVGHTLLEANKPNANKDMILSDKLDWYARVLKGQACTWQHEQDLIIGAILNADYVGDILACNTRFWESRANVADMVATVRDKYNNKNLKFSFENLVAKVGCSECGNEYPAIGEDGTKDHYCSHLKARFEPGSTAARVLLDFIPIGEGVVDVPAYKDSKALIAANKSDIERLERSIEKLNALLNKITK